MIRQHRRPSRGIGIGLIYLGMCLLLASMVVWSTRHGR